MKDDEPFDIPDGLVGDHNVRPCRRFVPNGCYDWRQLLLQDGIHFATFSLLKCLSDTRDHLEIASEGLSHLGSHLVRHLLEQRTAFAVAKNNIGNAHLLEHPGRDLPGVGALVVRGTVLCGERDGRVRQQTLGQLQVDGGGRNHDLRLTSSAGIVFERAAELADHRGRPVGLPVAAVFIRVRRDRVRGLSVWVDDHARQDGYAVDASDTYAAYSEPLEPNLDPTRVYPGTNLESPARRG